MTRAADGIPDDEDGDDFIDKLEKDMNPDNKPATPI